ncbi:transmembrane protein 17B-like [Lingula anatina]|uniref:Transmembrane protein 17B-like n=2 Tax=Lingula anatina TaxID=7574 RepID=A0A1S3KGD0_LINAN|nr:transmembrane protein 17B-like [Lingula anatina]|eukprot:XP_013421693.1 transmembrane protein 17B-like [Lingula anatina]
MFTSRDTSNMAATMRRAVTQVTDVVFPVSRASKDGQQHHILNSGNEYMSNLPLQMSLYFNVFYYPIWLVTAVVMLEAKYLALDTLYQIILIAVLVVMTIVEAIRLYLGYVGNLTEKVPELAGFWLLTLLLQLPLIMFLLFNEAAVLLPLERAMHIVMFVFILFEGVCGYFAIRIMVNYQVTKFHMQQFTELEDLGYEKDD